MEIVRVLFQGFGENLRIFVLTLAMSIPLGLVITFGSMSRFTPLRWLTRTFVWIIRGTPLMLQLFVVLYAPGLVFGVPMRDRLTDLCPLCDCWSRTESELTKNREKGTIKYIRKHLWRNRQ